MLSLPDSIPLQGSGDSILRPGSWDSIRRGDHSDGTDHEVSALDTIHDVEADEWNELVERSPRASIFHRHEWLAAVEDGLGYRPRHLVVTKDDNLVGLWPNFVRAIDMTPFRRLSSVYPGYGGPLISTDVEAVLTQLVETVPSLCSGTTIVHELRLRDPDYLRYHDFLRARGYKSYRGECRHTLDLTRAYDDILAGMSGSRRRAINRGRDTDHEIVEEPLTDDTVARFHETYERAMDRVGGRVYPREFFDQLRALESRLLFLTLRVEGEYAGGMLELLDDEQSTIYGFVAGIPEEYYTDGASELLYEYVFRWGVDSDYRTYDFGNSSADFQDGLFMYKDSFGGQVTPSFIWERGCSPLWPPVAMARQKHYASNR